MTDSVDHRHDSFRAAVGTGVAYGLILAAMFLALFVVPWLLFALF
ncbi:hypothetical protein ACFO0N_12590 [Halobium salinum]|uniref:Uncharacterized protein n=1 Tax=Halobium salinum TaxID=1364940 RepID=A0ABD5PCZ2_9EURY|nr:hypothetical protein [Halobium salinum]